MKRYVFKSIDDTKKFFMEVLVKEDILNFNYSYNCIEFLQDISKELEEMIKKYGGEEVGIA